MKLRLLLVCLAILSPLSSAVAAPTKSVAKAHRTVTDYFSLLPSRYFEVKNRHMLLQKSFLPIIDLKNDYMQTTGDGAQPHLEIAVFRYRGRDTVAVTSYSEMDYSFDLWRYENRKWRNVTDDLSPMISKGDLHFVLPRYGTTIKVFQTNGTHLANLYWEKGQFSAESFDPTGHR
jgi:hypothetical protein